MMVLSEVGYWSSSIGQFERVIPGVVWQNGVLKLVSSTQMFNLVRQSEMV